MIRQGSEKNFSTLNYTTQNETPNNITTYINYATVLLEMPLIAVTCKSIFNTQQPTSGGHGKKLNQIHTKSTLKANLGVDLLSTQGIRDIPIWPLKIPCSVDGQNNDEFIFFDRWNTEYTIFLSIGTTYRLLNNRCLSKILFAFFAVNCIF